MQKRVKHRVYGLPVVLFLFLSMLFVAAGVYLERDEKRVRISKAQSVAQQVKIGLEVFSNERIQAIQNLMRTWPTFQPNQVDWFNAQAVSLMGMQRGFSSLTFADSNQVIQWVALPTNTLASRIDNTLHGDTLERTGLFVSAQKEALDSTLVYSDVTEHHHILVGRAISPQEPEHGYIVAGFDVQNILGVMLGELVGPQFNFVLRANDEDLYSSGSFIDDGTVVTVDSFPFIEREFTLSMQSIAGSYRPGLLLTIIGLFMSALASWIFHKQMQGAVSLTVSQQRYQTASDASLDALLIYQPRDGDFALVEANRYSRQLFHGVDENLLSAPLSEQLAMLGHSELLPKILHVIESGEPFEQYVSIPSDIISPDWIKVQVVKAADTIALTVRDVTKEHALQEEVAFQANHDQLTGLLNRYAFDNELKDILSADTTPPENIAHEGEDVAKSLGVMCFVDMDRFKLVNDSCGHPAGDKLLKEVSALFAQHIGESDLLARIGGDEFCFIYRGQSLEEVKKRLDRLLDAISSYRFVYDEKLFFVGASIGVIEIDPNATSAADLIKAADNACYKAKHLGRNRYFVYQAKDAHLATNNNDNDVLNSLHNALQYDGFELFSQAIVPLTNSLNVFQQPALEHFEILLRLSNKDGALISPGLFIPLAERHGLMNKVDLWVVENTLKALDASPDYLPKIGKVAINLSGITLGDEITLHKIVEYVEASQVPANKICFEITETTAVTNLNAAKLFISTLRALGCRFALDDFGAGMSSFMYLKNLDVDYVKIDGSFVRNMVNDKIDRATVKAINSIAHSMGKETVAEFVGDNETCEALRTLRVDFGQGFALDKPKPLSHRISWTPNLASA
ncbi:EAL domain-containing protein [Alteromonas sp. KUL49]|uniref:putative bifunctional diguanylate cyclase/phosphodiesterase n=1 Tax=Alteromonas sp. KUL49 TaxID=2480798 RepID=UPI00102ED5BA|nr:EAL domain-containing protein [Alteromonas sp. KUL49]TAP34949.1 EAL domain-containing protein [Alteromonas sp. KUL49]GEA13492.1 hypothetical protein KUL49_38670 [Alteromonas sp. KUL49]